MTVQLVSAINNRDGAALAKMAGGRYEPGKVISSEAEQLVDSLFRQLKQIFPAAASTSLKTESDEKTTKRQWIAAFSENGIKTREQLSAGVRHARASDSAFWPSPGQFVKWCKDSSVVLGVTFDDVMAEFHRYNRDRNLHTGGAEQFPWSKPVMYWIVCDTRRAMYQRQLSESEVEKFAQKKLDEWSKKVSAGEKIPDPIMRLENNKTVIPVSSEPDKADYKYRYMPNAAMLGGVTPSQWLYAEYQRRKSLGLCG
ncbi:replication protein P [uncultured Cedecea sp.]|uniref:replication protein P n=1 Tax=uncultured Cedecea sp. TaxID=988762 RepID=UPI0026338A8A|nr:replication protein P [uncultured Cedecea sp.]